MIERWTTVAVLEAEKKFRRLKGHAGMPQLIAALTEFETAGKGLVSAKEAA